LARGTIIAVQSVRTLRLVINCASCWSSGICHLICTPLVIQVGGAFRRRIGAL